MFGREVLEKILEKERAAGAGFRGDHEDHKTQGRDIVGIVEYMSFSRKLLFLI